MIKETNKNITKEEQGKIANQMWEAASLVNFANTGKIGADIDVYQKCTTQLAFIAKCIAEIRAKGFGKDVKPNTFTN